MYESTILHFAELAAEKVAAMQRSALGFLVGSILAGAYIGIAMILALSAAAGLPAGVRPLVMGFTFGVGLILTVFSGAELFTGYVMYFGFGLARGTVGATDALRTMATVWIGNLVGAAILVTLFVLGGGGAVFADGASLLHAYAAHKVDAGTVALLSRAALCNWLVCLAIWTASRVHDDTAKCIVLAWILAAFVAAGFEHSIANMTALGLGLLVPDPSVSFEGSIRNLVLVTAGNVFGGLVFIVGGYLAAARSEAQGAAGHDAGVLPTTLRVPAEPSAR